MKHIYLAAIEPAEGGFGVFFPDLPGCTSAGPTVEDAALNAVEAAQSHVALLTEEGEEVPLPRKLDEIKFDDDVEIAQTILVPVEVEDDKVRVNITLAKSVLAHLDAMARSRGVDRSSMIAFLATSSDRDLVQTVYVGDKRVLVKAVSHHDTREEAIRNAQAHADQGSVYLHRYTYKELGSEPWSETGVIRSHSSRGQMVHQDLPKRDVTKPRDRDK